MTRKRWYMRLDGTIILIVGDSYIDTVGIGRAADFKASAKGTPIILHFIIYYRESILPNRNSRYNILFAHDAILSINFIWAADRFYP